MDWKWKLAIAGGVVVAISSMGFIIKTQYDTIEKLKVIETSVVESKTLGNGIVRAQSAFATKQDLEAIIKQNAIDLFKITQDMNKLGASVKTVQVVKTITPGYVGQNLSSTQSNTNPNVQPENANIDKYGYLKTTQWLELKEPFDNNTSIPFGKTGFSAGQEKPWSLEVKQREYKTITVTGEDDDGRTYAYSKVSVSVDGKEYIVPVSENKVVEQYPDANFSFSPRIFMGIDGGIVFDNSGYFGEIFPNVGLSLFSYGRGKGNPTWTFAELGLGYEANKNNIGLFITPAQYNVGKNLPLVDNLFIGPSISIDMNVNVGVYLGVHVGL